MPFKFNPFTDNLDQVNAAASGTGILTVTGNAGSTGADGLNNINLLGSGSISFTANPVTFTVTASISGGGVKWNTVAAGGALAVNNGYVCAAPAGALSFSLPAVAAVGDVIELSLDGATSWTITQGIGQQIRISSLQTTAGVAGSIASTAQGDSVKLVCSIANTRFNVVSSMGNINVT
jgi:hypothetical protein